MFAAIAEAYEVLSDETRRKAYDATLTPSTTGSSGGHDPRSEPRRTSTRTPYADRPGEPRPPRAPHRPRFSTGFDTTSRQQRASTRPAQQRRGPGMRFLVRTWPGAVVGIIAGVVRVYMFTRIVDSDTTPTYTPTTLDSVTHDIIILNGALWGLGGWLVGAGACALVARIMRTSATWWIGPVAAIVAGCSLPFSAHPSVPVVAGFVLWRIALIRRREALHV